MADKDLRVNLKADDDITPKAKKAKASLDAIPDTVSTKVTADVDSSGLDDLAGKLGDLPGLLGDLGSKMSGAGGIAAGAGLAAAAVNDLAQGFADAAVEARVTADLTGASIEDASRLQAVWKQSGADINDLNDVLLQMNGVLQTSPEMAAKIGVNLKDGADIGSRFVEIVQKIQTSTLGASDKAQLMSQMFGEEGVRQVAKLTASIDGPLSSALEDVSEAQIIDPGEEQRAKDLTAATKELGKAWTDVKMTLGELFLEPVTNSMVKTNAVVEGLKKVLSGDFWDNSGMDAYAESLGEVGAEFKVADFAGGNFGDTVGVLGSILLSSMRASQSFAASSKDLNEALHAGAMGAFDGATAMYELMKATEAAMNMRRGLADSEFAYRDASREFAQAIIDTTAALADADTTALDGAAALDEFAQSAGDAADAAVRLEADQMTAAGATQDATQAQRTWNSSMITSARQAEGPLRDSIVKYIATVNGIPPEKVSEILANPDYASIDAANAAIDRAAADETARITAEANTAQAERDLAEAARNRTATIYARMVAAGGGSSAAGGVPIPAMVPMSVGPTATATAAVAVPAAAALPPIHVTVAAPAPSSVTIQTGIMGNRFDSQRVLVKALRAHQRLNGLRE